MVLTCGDETMSGWGQRRKRWPGKHNTRYQAVEEARIAAFRWDMHSTCEGDGEALAAAMSISATESLSFGAGDESGHYDRVLFGSLEQTAGGQFRGRVAGGYGGGVLQ